MITRFFVLLFCFAPKHNRIISTTRTASTFVGLQGHPYKHLTTAHRFGRVHLSTQLDSTVGRNEAVDYDYLVIGAGSGGIASARRAATYGAKTAVVENKRLGGTCVNVGCVPKKVMWNAASIAETLHGMKHYGFHSHANSFDWPFLKKNRDNYVSKLNGIYERNIVNSNVTLIEGTASFTDDVNNIVIKGKDGSVSTIHAKHVLISTGGHPTFPDGPGIQEHAISSDGFFALKTLPPKAVVVGAGYIAVELAGVLQALGTDTSLVLRKGKALRSFDDILSDALDEEMQKQGIHIHRNTNGVESIELNSTGRKVVHLYNGDSISDVDCVLIATGRAPMVDCLNLPVTIKQRNKEGYIVTNEYSETTVPNIYALGDVVGKVELTPMAIAAGRRLADRLFGGPQFTHAKVSYETVPTVVFSHPPIGTIGLTEQQALQRYGSTNVKVYTSKFSNLYYGIWPLDAKEKPQTAMKLICTGSEEKVVGLHAIGIGADEMLQGFGVAMKMGATKADMDSCIALHPTAAEELVTMSPWGLSEQTSGAKGSPLNGARVLPRPIV